MTDDERAATLAEINADALALFGKPLRHCDHAEVEEMKRRCAAEIIRRTAGLDQLTAAMTETERCRCSVVVDVDDHGKPDASHARVRHTCAGAA